MKHLYEFHTDVVYGFNNVKSDEAWTAFTKILASWVASCCCTLPARENIRSMHCSESPRHNLWLLAYDAASCRVSGVGHLIDDLIDSHLQQGVAFCSTVEGLA
jgi:hypothetical protein